MKPGRQAPQSLKSRTRPYRGEKGQASLLLGTITLTFILFLAFVINTGMLVNAKINLQNAADLAAYSGAATQARQLTKISYLNYEMRRQYKKFLFRYYIIGNAFYASMPAAPVKQPRIWSPDGFIDYGVPVVCVNLAADQQENYCHVKNGTLPQIAIPNSNPLDQINETLRQQLQSLESLRQKSCSTIAVANLHLLNLWLYNTDPDGIDPNALVTGITDNMQKATVLQAYTRAVPLTYGLGLVPREIILKERIETLRQYVDAPARQNLTLEQVQAMQNGPDPNENERSINAFLSAHETLGQYTFGDDSSITMDELLPAGKDGSNVLQLKPIVADFDAYALNYVLDNPSAGTNAANCLPKLFPVTVNKLPLGVYKDPTILTFYAIRLKAKARVLFSPFGDVELKAYSAAMPFGSRIGPAIPTTDNVFTYQAQANPNYLADLNVGSGNQSNFEHPSGHIPNLPILDGETASQGQGWDTQAAQYYFYQQYHAQPGTTTIMASDTNFAIQAAMAPNPYEKGKYNIITDLGDDPFVRNFDTNLGAAIWAPIVPADKVGQIQQVLSQEVEDLFNVKTPPMVGGNATYDVAAAKQALLSSLAGYVQKLQQGQGEGDPYSADAGAQPIPEGAIREGVNIALLNDPLHQRLADMPAGQPPGPIQLDPSVMMRDPASIRSSWDSVLDPDFKKAGRVGYSVKFVSFDSLSGHKFKTDGQNSFDNSPDLVDGEAQSDIAALRH